MKLSQNSIWTSTISQENITTNGIYYFIRAIDVSENTNTSTTNYIKIYPVISVRGTIYDKSSYLPVSSAKITIGTNEKLTDASGKYLIIVNKYTNWTVKIEKSGYFKFETKINVSKKN